MVQLSFTSKIAVTNDYLDFHCSMQGEEPEYCGMEKSVASQNAYTFGAAPCTAGGFSDGSSCLMFHYLDPCIDYFEKLDNKSKGLNLKSKPSAIVTGGYSLSSISSRCYEKVIEQIKKTGIKPSIIWGQKGCSTSLNYCAQTDTWTLYNDTNKIKNLKDLKDTYSIVEISDNDELWIEGKRVK